MPFFPSCFSWKEACHGVLHRYGYDFFHWFLLCLFHSRSQCFTIGTVGTYVNPLNQLFLFAGGVLIGHAKTRVRALTNLNLSVLVVFGLALLFCFFPSSGHPISIVTGWQRILYSSVCFLICHFVFTSQVVLNGRVHLFFAFLGETSYSIYLLHPIVYRVLKVGNQLTLGLHASWVFWFSITTTLVASLLSYRLIEKPIVQFGKRISAKNH